ncbi:hypothetical protein [Nocardia sp. NPDC024068]|uniref:hypothetical protein n=1 Tax=Nocardia sp. NPDC024068 TaxID=3157197 RepID=UPI00340987DB
MTQPDQEDGGRPPLSQQDKRARVGATAAAIAIAAVVTSIVLGIGVAALLATAGGGEEPTADLAAPTPAVTTGPVASTQVPGVPAAPSSVASSAPAAPTTTPPASGIAGEMNKEAKEAPPKVEVAAGECLSGFGEKDVTKAACGSAESRYKVTSAGPPGTTCPADADAGHTVAETTLCLDIDWVVGSCVDVSGDQPQRVECGPGGMQVVSILPETNNVNACPSADNGFVYDERRFVVCFTDL